MSILREDRLSMGLISEYVPGCITHLGDAMSYENTSLNPTSALYSTKKDKGSPDIYSVAPKRLQPIDYLSEAGLVKSMVHHGDPPTRYMYRIL
jgi:hypothetical protein